MTQSNADAQAEQDRILLLIETQITQYTSYLRCASAAESIGLGASIRTLNQLKQQIIQPQKENHG